MSSIDDRIVNMQFNNAQFQKGVAETNNSLADLKRNLQLDGASAGIDQVQGAANRFSLGNMESALTHINSMFSVFGAVGFTVIQDVTNAVINAGQRMAGALVDPIVQGGAKRALALQQAKFQFQGLGLDVQSTMDAALAAVKGTAFGLDDAATAAAQFGASGINATNGLADVLRGVAGVAAQTGSSYESVANIFESVAGNGRLMGQDLLQLSSRGVNAAAVLAKSMGTTEATVRQMVTDGKISFQQFSDAMNAAFGANAANANQTYTGALDNMHAALARIGADVASPYFLGMRDVFNALTPVFDTIHTAIQPLINDFASFQSDRAASFVTNIQTLMGSGLLTAIQNIVTAVKVLGLAFQNAFRRIFPDDTTNQLTAIGGFLERITAALIPGTIAFLELQRALAGVFAIFDILGRVIGQAINMLVSLFGFTFQGSGSFLAFAASVGDWLVKVDDAIKKGTALQDFFRVLGNIIQVPISIMKTFFGVLADGVALLGHFNTSGLDAFADDVKSRFTGLIQLGQIMDAFWAGVIIAAKAVWDFVGPLFGYISAAIQAAVSIIGQMLKGVSFDDALQVVNTGLFAGFLIIVKKFTDTLKTIFTSNGGLVGSIKGVFNELTNSLKAMQAGVNAKTLETIAIAVALLAASAVALSLVDTIKLTAALAAIGGLMASLIGTFAAVQKIAGAKGTIELNGVAVMFVIMADAILVLAAAVAILSALPFARLSASIGAIIVLLGAMVATLASISKIGPDVILGVAAIAILAPALVILAGAVAILAAIPFDNMALAMGGLAVSLGILIGALWSINKIGPAVLIGVAAIAILAPALAVLAGAIAILAAIPFLNLALGLGALAVAMGIMIGSLWAIQAIGPGVIIAAGSLGLVAVSISILAGAVAIFAAMSVESLVKGFIALAAGMVILVGAILLLSLAGPEVILGAAAMITASIAITILAGALKIVSTMSWDDIGRTIVVLAGALLILVGAMALMGIPIVALGALGMIVAATAMMILAPALKIMGSMSWDDIGRGLALLGASLAILAVGGVLLIPASVGFLLLGVAILLIGEGVYLAAIGVGMLAIAIGLLVIAGTGGIGLLSVAIDTFISKLPELGIGIAGALINMIITIGAQAPQLITAFVQLLLAMLAAIDQVVPALVNTAVIIIITLVNALVILIPFLVDAGLKMITGILTGIANNIGGIVTQGVNIMVNFLNALASKIPDIIAAGGNVVLKFINGISDYINNNSGKFISAGSSLFKAIVNGVSSAIENGGSLLAWAGAKIGNAILQGAKNALGINSPSKKFRDEVMPSVFEGIEDGNDNNLSRASDAGSAIGDTITQSAISSVKSAVAGISEAMNADLDASPTIRPVLDLSDFKKNAATIPGLLPKPSLSLDTSNDVATSVSLQEQAKNAQLVIDATAPATPSTTVNFTQNNNSPKALTTPEIYRQTKNQLSTLKGDLGVVDQSGSPQ